MSKRVFDMMVCSVDPIGGWSRWKNVVGLLRVCCYVSPVLSYYMNY
jgi:hypothetical protein